MEVLRRADRRRRAGHPHRDRADAHTFESVWAKIGKPCFPPRSVQALEVPYGFARDTQATYPTSLDLLAELVEEVRGRRFDVALIAAGGLGIPLACAIRD